MVLVPKLRGKIGVYVERLAARLPPYPDAYTLAGLAVTFAGCALVLRGNLWVGVALFVLGALLDALDGAVARAHRIASRKGGFLDSLSDRLSDAAITYGYSIFAPAWLVYTAAVAALVYSYARARAEAAICKKLEGVGILERGERLPIQVAVYLVYGLVGNGVALMLLAAYTVALLIALVDRSLRLYRALGYLDSGSE